MSLNFVSLVCDLFDGQETPVAAGTLAFAPDATLAGSADHVLITRAPVIVSLLGNPQPVIQLAATDNEALSPPGWSWVVTAYFPGAPPRRSFALPFSDGPVQYLSEVS